MLPRFTLLLSKTQTMEGETTYLNEKLTTGI
jgi:hypothetical protein